MNDSDFVAYVGDPDIHDGRILSVDEQESENCGLSLSPNLGAVRL
jgi:hypothetical protein